MGHHHSTQPRNNNSNVVKRKFKSFAKKTNTKSSKLSNVHDNINKNNNNNNNHHHETINRRSKLRFKLRLSQSQKSSQSSQFSSTSSIPSIESQTNDHSFNSVTFNTVNNSNHNNMTIHDGLPSLHIINDDVKCDDDLFIEENNHNINTIKDMMVDLLKQENNKQEITANYNRSRSTSNNSENTQTAADYEKFFIAFHQKQQQKKNDMSVYNTAIQHRVAFVSLIGLYQSFRRIPTHILFSAMFILKIKREWLYNPMSHANDPKNVLHTLQYDKDHEFCMLLKWKDSQGLMFFMYHDEEEQSMDVDEDVNNDNDENKENTDDNEQEIMLPNDLGIDNDSDDADDLKLDINDEIDDEIDINDENVFAFAANLPMSSPTHSLHSINEHEINEIISAHHTPNNKYIDNGFDFDINMHEMDMTTNHHHPIHLPNRLSLTASKSNGPNLPLTPSASDDLNNFVPPLRLQRNDSNVVNVSDYNNNLMQTINEEDEEEKEDEDNFKFQFLDDENDDDIDDEKYFDDEDDDDDDMLNFNIDDDDEFDEEEEPQCQQRPNLRLTLGDNDRHQQFEEDDQEEPELDPITPADFGYDDEEEEENPHKMANTHTFMINPIWNELSDILSTIYDPFEGSNYSPLILDEKWWTAHFKQSQYGTSSKDVLQELNQCEMSYRSVMEILFQSNPSLIPCKTYRELENVSPTTHSRPRPKKLELDEINFISNTSSMTVVDSHTDYFDNEYSHQYGDFDYNSQTWMIDDYDSNRRKYTATTLSHSFLN